MTIPGKTHEPQAELMLAGEAYQPCPRPSLCSAGVCGGTGWVHLKVNGVEFVKRCQCRLSRIAAQAAHPKKRKRRK